MAVDKYLNLVTSEHKTKPKFMSWLSANLGLIDDATNAMNNIIFNFDIDNAAGMQLDTLGKIIGISRMLNFQPSDGSSPVLDDTTYRMLLKSKIVSNNWDGTIGEVQALWNDIFSQYRLIMKDNQNMSVSAIAVGSTTTLQKQMITSGLVIPRPVAVAMNYSFMTNIIFAYDINDGATYGGYDVGYWIQSL